MCSYRTYEEWKLLDDTRSSTWNLSSYRTYEEWKPTTRDIASITFLVLTVPMRNGNRTLLENILGLVIGSYRTYEDWKLFQRIDNLISFIEFLPYLWGMETLYCKKRRWRSRVLTVPMRNGNRILKIWVQQCLNVLTVPMRNGNRIDIVHRR